MGRRAEASRARGGRTSGSERRVRRLAAWGPNIEGGGGNTEVGGSIEGGGVEGGGANVGNGVEGGGGSAEVGSGVEVGGVEGGSAEVGQPDGAKPNFTVIRVSRQRGYSPYTRYIFGIG
jgi:hypothetical protein